MKIVFDNTPEQIAAVQAMASKDRLTAEAAQIALAEFIGPVLSEVVNTAATLSTMFTDMPFAPDTNPSLPLDLFYDVTDHDYITVYSQSAPGGLASNLVVPTASELKFQTYTLDSAWSFDSKYARMSRLDVVGKTFARIMQEILFKQETTSANILLGTLADNATAQLKSTSTSLDLTALNNLFLTATRVNSAWDNGTPESPRQGVTDIVVSPERMRDLRALAFNPISTTASHGIEPTDGMKQSIFTSGGVPNFFGLGIRQINELGENQRYTQVFDELYSGDFDSTADDLVLGVDLSREYGLTRAVSTDPDSNSQFDVMADDQFVARQRKIGFYGALEEGRMCLDSRTLFGIKIDSAAD